MNLKRLFRLAAISGAVAAAVAAVRALTRDQDPLPSPADGPTEPWPPLRSATTGGTTSDTADGAADEEAPAAEGVAAEPADTAGADDEVDGPDEESEPEPEPVDDADDEPEPEEKAAPTTSKRRKRPLRAPWMPPNDDGSCPDGYPLKANDQSMIFHAPGQMSYDRTVPERCYADADVAIADGYRAAKR